MAELNAPETTSTDPCCAPEQQTACCEPGAKADCCGHEEGCGCAAGGEPTQPTDAREQARERYAAAAVQVTSTDPGAGCCAPFSQHPSLRHMLARAGKGELCVPSGIADPLEVTGAVGAKQCTSLRLGIVPGGL
jgi:hypothetical protein